MQALDLRDIERPLASSAQRHCEGRSVSRNHEQFRAMDIDVEEGVGRADLLMDIELITLVELTAQSPLMRVVEEAVKPSVLARIDQDRAFTRRSKQQRKEEQHHEPRRTRAL